MATLHDINHNAGGVPLTFWDNEIDASAAVSVGAAGGLNGTANGLIIDTSVADTKEVWSTYTPPASNEVRIRAYFDPNGLASYSGLDGTDIIKVGIGIGSQSIANCLLFFRLDFDDLSGDLQARAFYGTDSGFLAFSSNPIILTDTEHCFELSCIRGATDGEARYWFDGTLRDTVTSLNNDGRFDGSNRVYAGGDNSGNGFVDVYVDEIFVTDDASASLGCSPATAAVLGLAAMTKPADIDAAGEFIYVALLENGTPILTKISTALNADGTTVFDPGAGDNIGVECGRFNSDVVWVAGNFDGTNVIEKSEDGGTTFTVKDDATIGNVRTFVMGPDSDEKLLIFDETNGDILETKDDGASWDSINASVTPEINAIGRLGRNTQETVFGNQGAANNSINYSVNSGNDLEDYQTGVYPSANATRVIVN